MIKINEFKVIGISVRTSNNNGENIKDVGALWQKFMSENLSTKIPNKISNEIYSIYTEYDGDYTLPYTTILGCKVSTLDNIPDGMVGKSFGIGNYTKFTAAGNLMDGIIAKKWQKIWQTDNELNRAYTQDFEVYDDRSINPESAVIDIFVAVKA